jgi:hypothetical protein
MKMLFGESSCEDWSNRKMERREFLFKSSAAFLAASANYPSVAEITPSAPLLFTSNQR